MSEEHEHAHPDYWKIYKWLVLLFVISYLGPELFPEQKSIVLLTAFGIAVVKALMVVSEFMHLNVEKPVIWYLMLTCLILLFVFFAGVAPDVLNKSGNNWVADSATAGTYVIKKKEPEKTKPEETKPKTADSNSTEPAVDKPDPKLVAQGKALFQGKICFTCHQTDPDSPVFKDSGKVESVKMDEAYFMESVEKPNAKVVKGAIAGMAPLPTTLEERKALAAYVKSLSK